MKESSGSNDVINLFRSKIRQWYEKNRRNFCWRLRKLSPYEVLVLEIMLQKTRAEKVGEIFPTFISKYPSPQSLASATIKELENDLLPLGLNKRRALLIKRTAEIICKQFNGEVPGDYESLEKLPGVGQYIASAVLCFGFGEKVLPVDVNAKRLFERVFGIEIKNIRRLDGYVRDFLSILLTPEEDVMGFVWAILDFSALICKKRDPNHGECPLKDICKFNQRSQ